MEKTKIEQIYDVLLPEIEALGVEITDDVRLAALQGLRDGWLEDKDEDDYKTDKIFWVIAANIEIMRLELKLGFPS